MDEAGREARHDATSGQLTSSHRRSGRPTPGRPTPTPGRIVLAWLLVVGIDLFFNAGLVAWMFDQRREPNLLPDTILFRRIPAAYLALALSVVALAWLVDRIQLPVGRAAAVGGIAGLVVGVQGLGALWTAIDITGVFVMVGIAILAIQGAAAGWLLASPQPVGRLVRWVVPGFVALVVLGQVAANVIGG